MSVMNNVYFQYKINISFSILQIERVAIYGKLNQIKDYLLKIVKIVLSRGNIRDLTSITHEEIANLAINYSDGYHFRSSIIFSDYVS